MIRKPSSSLIARIVLLAACWLALAGELRAQVVTILHNYGDGSVLNDGTGPLGAPVQGTNGYFYGTTQSGGSAVQGAVYEITPTGTIEVLHSAADGSVANDGTDSLAGLVQGTDGNFYGTTNTGGSARNGTVFQITPQAVVTILHSFGDGSVPNDGINPQAGLVQGSDGNFYGTTQSGGKSNTGTIFKITPQGVVTILHSFNDGSVPNDGSNPYAGLVQGADGNFYGTTSQGGGSASAGTVFQMTAQGTVTILHSFQDGTVTNDGRNPVSGLVQGADGNFYGTTQGGGLSSGAIFKITPTGTVTTLHSFGDGSVFNDGTIPVAGLIRGVDGNFYGMTQDGGAVGFGTIFEITPQGTVTILHSFEDGTVANDGQGPGGALVQGADGNFYGVTPGGGSSGSGVFFSFAPNLPLLTSLPSAEGTVSLPFSYQTSATKAPTSYVATNLPAGLSINTTTGLISGTPTAPGMSTVNLTLTNTHGSSTVALPIFIAPLPTPSVTSILVAYGSLGNPFTYTITGNDTTTSFDATGLTGTGLSFDASTGIISGTPTSTGTFPVTLTATNSVGTGPPVTLSIQIFDTPATLSQEYNPTYVFGSGSGPDGSTPGTILQGFDGNFYGITLNGGGLLSGTLYELDVQGNETLIFPFNGDTGVSGPTSLIQGSDGNFYGTTQSNQIFEVGLATEQLSVLYSFSGDVGANNLVQGADGNFYGTTPRGGTASDGMIYKLTPQGVLTVLHNFGDTSVTGDGITPLAGLIQDADGNFYGTTSAGGSAGNGTVFEITAAGTYLILHNFGDNSVPNDGATPQAGLIQGVDGNLYGTTSAGGFVSSSYPSGGGTAFEMTPQGTVTILHNFSDGSVQDDGAQPAAGLIQGYDGNFYGTTQTGGLNNSGAVFQITPQGFATTIHSFGDGSVPNDGMSPLTGLIQSVDGNFYGTTSIGGVTSESFPSGSGTVYSIISTQTPAHVPVFTGSDFVNGSLQTPFSYTPSVYFGVSGSDGNIGSSVKVGSSRSFFAAFLPQFIIKALSQATNWTIAGNLPNYLSFNSTSGTISGTPVETGTFTVTLTAHNAAGSGTPQTVTLYIDVPPVFTSATTATATVGTPFSYQVSTANTTTSFGVTNLPGWLSADPTTGIVSGTPPAGTNYSFNTQATNGSGQSSQQVALTVTGGASAVPTITSPTTASATAGVSFTYQITTATPATSYSALVLPTGLQFDSTSGAIVGTPGATGLFPIPISASNAAGSYATVLSLTVGGVPQPVINGPLSTSGIPNKTFSYAIPVTGTVSTYTATGLPAGLSLDNFTGVISGIPTVTGSFPVAVTATNPTGTASTTLTITLAVPILSFSQWEASYNISSGATATPENDGVPNLLKYLYDINPTQPMSATDRAALPVLASTTINTTSYLTLTYRQYVSAMGITINVQTSPDLKTWTTLANPTITQTGSYPDTGDLIMQVQVPVSGTREFVRLNVTLP